MYDKKVKALFLILAIIFSIVLNSSFKAYSKIQSEIEKGIVYLKSQPQTAWSTMALAANKEQGIDLTHLKSVPTDQKSATTYAKNILALVAAGEDPTNFGDENYVERLKSYYQNNQFGEEALINDDVWAVLALASLGQENLSQALAVKNYILNFQNSDGGWGYSTSSSSDTNSTAATLMALLETGLSPESSEIQKAISYLRASQNNDGGFPYTPGAISDSCSDAWTISAIYKLGQNPTHPDWGKNDKNPLKNLLSFQDEDGGFWWQREGDNKFCTAYSILALLEKSYPVSTDYNEHSIRIEGLAETICEARVHGGTAMAVLISAARACNLNYSIAEYPGMGLYLSQLNGETSWMYIVNNNSPLVGADNYYLNSFDEVLWYSGDWLDKGWFLTKVELAKTSTDIIIQAKYFDSQTSNWEDLTEEVKIQIGGREMFSDASGKLSIGLSDFSSGLYSVFIETQIIEGKGYIRSTKLSFSCGEVPENHQVGLKVEIEKIEPSEEEKQESINFSLTPDFLDFGKMKVGKSSTLPLTLQNGDSSISVQSEVNGDDVFRENIEIDKTPWQVFSTTLAANQEKFLEVKLTIPHTYKGEFGVRNGELTFWATKK